jgi:hypothetical protein
MQSEKATSPDPSGVCRACIQGWECTQRCLHPRVCMLFAVDITHCGMQAAQSSCADLQSTPTGARV